jgi:Protein of unknown function (DUF2939)
MRTTILISAALLAVWLAYAASPFFAVYDLLRIVQERNLAELPARVDFPAVRRSLTAQIVRTYLRISGKTGQRGSTAEQFVVHVGASLADPIVAKLVSPETFLDLLRNGRPSDVFSEDTPSVNGLSSEALKNLWRVYANSELGIARFFLDVPVDKPQQETFRLQFCLNNWTWRLCGVELPELLQVRLAQEVLKREPR